MIRPVLQDDRFLADVAEVTTDGNPRRLWVWWLGQSGFLVGYEGEFLLFDPYLSDSLTRKYAKTDKPHVRMTERVVDPARLEFVSVMTSTHNHTDHLDAETLGAIIGVAPTAKLVVPAANVSFVTQRLGAAAGRLVPLADGERAAVGAFTFEAVPAAHEELASEYAGFVVSVGPFRIYHSGDTVRFPGMAERVSAGGVIDLALLPINGRAPERRVSGNLDGAEAAHLAHDLGARCVVPCHYEMFEFNTASPAEFVAACARLGQRAVVLRAGERLVLDAKP